MKDRDNTEKVTREMFMDWANDQLKEIEKMESIGDEWTQEQVEGSCNTLNKNSCL